METVPQKNTEFRISINGLVTIGILFLLYGVSCVVPAGIQLHKSDFSSILVLLALALGISAVWMLLYWLLDRLQREPVQKAAGTFLSAAVICLGYQCLFSWIAGSPRYSALQDILIPLLSFLTVFTCYVIRLDSFDELVDPFIYGAFIGVGTAFSASMMEFVQNESLGIRFVIIELVTKISVHAAICALGGFLFHRAAIKKNVARLAVVTIIMLALFSAERLSEYLLQKNLAYASIKILPVLLSFVFIVAVVIITVALIHGVLRKSGAENPACIKIENHRPLLSCTAILFALALVASLVYRGNTYRTVGFVSPDGNWSFKLPAGYEEKNEVTTDSIFAFASAAENVYYKNASTDIWIDFTSKTASYSDMDTPSYHSYGWAVTENSNRYIAQDDDGYDYVQSQYIYVLKNSEKEIAIDAYTRDLDETEVKDAVRILIKTLEENHE